ncbi:MAG: DUF1559 domain-containing protein [Pirellulales bacterium]
MACWNRDARRRALTLIEILVVLGSLALLFALLLPAVQAAREAARRLQCQSALRQHGIALTCYADLLGAYPPGWNSLGLGWSAAILPYIDKQALFEQIQFPSHQSGDWESATGNAAVIQQVVPLFRCPTLMVPEHLRSNRLPARVPGSYRGNAGSEATSDDRSTLVIPGAKSLEDPRQDGVFFACSRIRPADLRRGLSNTWTLLESRTDPEFIKDGQAMDYWYIGSPQIDGCRCDGGTAGSEFSEFVGTTYSRLNARLRDPHLHGVLMELAFGSYHAGGAFALRADGGVSFIDDAIDLAAYRAQSTRLAP